jgi:RHS repeat-associated protein
VSVPRSGSSDPTEAIALSCAYSCAVEQHFTYAWDEVNRIAHARRYDRDRTSGPADWQLAVEQRYLYDASNQRTVKTTTFRGVESGAERTALYVYPGDFERRGLQTTLDRTSYEAISGDTETQYGVGPRIVWRTGTRDDGLDRDQRITPSLTDLIQSTTAVIDLATGELVETGSYYANGARETYRSNETETVTPEPMGFTGKEADEEVGLTYFGHRYLMSRLGRWASPDPLQTHAVGGGEAVNGYHYVSGNVLQARDPLGLKSEPQPGGAAASKQVAAVPIPPQAAGDEGFQRLPVALQRAVTTRSGQGENYADLMRVARWRPGPAGGVQVRGPSADEFLTVLRTATVLDPAFRARVFAQDASETPVVMRAFPTATRIFVDGAEAGRGGAWGTHVVDMGDLLGYDSITDPNRQRPLGTTREQHLVHFMVEAISEVQQTGGG